MATITTRAAKGSALTFTEVDGNFTNLNAEGIANTNAVAVNTSAISSLQSGKLDKAGGTISGALTVSGDLTSGAVVSTSSSNNNQNGSGVTLTTPATEIVRLINGSLVSVAGMVAGSAGQKITITNATGVSVEIQNEVGSVSAANRIYTGTGGNITLADKGSISAFYDLSSQRWRIVASTGVGSVFVGCKYINTAGTALTTLYDVRVFPTSVFDTHSAYNTATGIWTCPISGKYEAYLRCSTVAVAFSTTSSITLTIQVNGSDVATVSRYGNGSSVLNNDDVQTVLNLTAGDTVGFVVRTSGATTMDTSSDRNEISIARIA